VSAYAIESSDAEVGAVEQCWAPFRVELAMDQTQAIALCQVLASTPGAQRSFRVVDARGRYVVRITRGLRLPTEVNAPTGHIKPKDTSC
jgi:hypothetical protein